MKEYEIKTRQGHDIIAKFRVSQWIDVIVVRQNEYGKDYVIGIGYNEILGNWNFGHYGYKTLQEATKAYFQIVNEKLKVYWCF